MRKIVAMAVICLTAASGLTSAYAAQLADDEAGLRIRLKNELRRADKPSAGTGRDIYAWVQGGLLDFNSGYYSNIIGVEGGAYYVYKLGARADMSTRWYLDGDKSFGFALGAVKIKPSENSLLKLISTRLVCCGFPFASGEGRRVVSVFTQPPWSILSPDILASCQAPWPIALTPGRMRGVTLAGSRTSPRWLYTRTISPLAIPRLCASIGLIHTS